MRDPFYSPIDLPYEFTSTTFRTEMLHRVLRSIAHWLMYYLNLLPDSTNRETPHRSLCFVNTSWVRGLIPELVSQLDILKELDTAFLRAEKIPKLHDILTGIIEVSLYPALRKGLSILRNSVSWIDDSFDAFDDVDVVLLRAIVPDATIAVPDGTISAPDIESAFIAFISAIVLSIVYQYLIGYVDRGGTKTYNSGSLEFRATYVSLLLFQGAYVWIKFRDVAARRTVYTRSRKDANGRLQTKYEPRFKPSREKGVDTGPVYCLPLGAYDTHRDAEIVCQIAGFYYGRDDGTVELEDGFQFPIPEMSEQERGLRGKEKKECVSGKAKAVFKELKEAQAAIGRQPTSNALSAIAGEQIGARDFLFPADQAADILAATNNGGHEFLSFSPGEIDRLTNVDDFFLSEDGVLDVAIQEGFKGELITREFLDEQLNLQKEQLEAEFNRRFAEQHEQHLQIQQRQEDQNLELRLEIEHTRSTLHEVINHLGLTLLPPLRSDGGGHL